MGNSSFVWYFESPSSPLLFIRKGLICYLQNSSGKFFISNKTNKKILSGYKEKEMNLPVWMLCVRVTTMIPDAQLFFMDFFVEDLVKTFNMKFLRLAVRDYKRKYIKMDWIEITYL